MASSSSVSSGSSQSLAQYRETIATLSGGKDANEEAWMTMWCSSNWAELLQPAPLSIALLGSVLCIASGTNDFSVYLHARGAVTGNLVQALTILGAQVFSPNRRKAYQSFSGSMSSTRTHSKRASCRSECPPSMQLDLTL
jgi:hypothetical protein